MTEKEFPIFAFEERRRFGESLKQNKNECSILEVFLDEQEIERKPKTSIFNVFVENLHQQYRRSTSSFYQIIRYENYILLEFLIEYYEDDNIDEICFKIESCNIIFAEEGSEGLKNIYKKVIKSKKNSDFLEKYRTHYNLHFIDCIRKSRNLIQVVKKAQEQTLKMTYKIDL